MQIAARPEMLYLAVGIVGATVMRTTSSHSSIVQTRKHDRCEAGIAKPFGMRLLIPTSRWGWPCSLTLGFWFWQRVYSITPVNWLRWSSRTPIASCLPCWGSPREHLIWCGPHRVRPQLLHHRNAGGADRHGGVPRCRVSRAKRALLTRCLAILPAVAVTAWYGSAGWELSCPDQVILGLQLPFAVRTAPLVHDQA